MLARAAGDGSTLDDLFRRAGCAPGAALIDPPNHESFTDARRATLLCAGRPHHLRLCRLPAPAGSTDTVVALQLPNTVEGVIALLGIMRARLIAAPLPLLWRKQEMVDALGRIGAKAIVTTARIGDTAHAELAMQVAAELFPIRYVCAFGRDLPDGVVPLDELLAPDHVDVVQRGTAGSAAAHVAAVTFDLGADGLSRWRAITELVAGGLAPYLEAVPHPMRGVLSAIPPAFCRHGVSVLPWLWRYAGAASRFRSNIAAAQCRQQNGAHRAPGRAGGDGRGRLPSAEAKTIVALWRSPERLTTSAPWRGEAALIDIASFGEIACSRR
jgi:hypothetical protein